MQPFLTRLEVYIHVQKQNVHKVTIEHVSTTDISNKLQV